MGYCLKVLTTMLIVSFIFIANGYSILLESTICVYYHSRSSWIIAEAILSLSATTFFLIAFLILVKYIKLGVVYATLPLLGLVYVFVISPILKKIHSAIVIVGLASIGTGLIITTFICILVLFRFLKLMIKLLRQQKRVLQDQASQRNIELTSHIEQQQQQQQQRGPDDELAVGERSFVSQLCKGGITGWTHVTDALIFIINGVVFIGSWELVISYDCADQLTGGMVMLTVGAISFALFCVKYMKDEEQGIVVPVLPPRVQAVDPENPPAGNQA